MINYFHKQKGANVIAIAQKTKVKTPKLQNTILPLFPAMQRIKKQVESAVTMLPENTINISNDG